MLRTIVSCAAIALAAVPAARAQPPAAPTARGGTLPGGAQWQAEVPANWNGTLLLWSRGYSPRAGEPDLAPKDWREPLLAQGYALVASNYGAKGWALAEAVPAQRATIAAFTKTQGQKPRRVIGWGASMGGLVTTALAEERKPAINGAIALCPSIGGAVGMMNMGLDGAFAFRFLLGSETNLELVEVTDDMGNSKRAAEVVRRAVASPAGRARLALAGVLAGIPGWTRPGSPQPAADDYETQLDEIAASFVMGTIFPRQDQETRAGGAFSWNAGVDYAAQLDLSGRRAFVEALYRKAGIDLDADLGALNNTPRIFAKPAAVNYMLRHYTPNARPRVPLLSVQAVGDGLTSPSLQRAYLDAASPRMAAGLWLDQAGHCNITAASALTALHHLEARLDGGKWPARPAGTVDHTPAPMLRPCLRGKRC